ncbi:MAG: biopolymer transporter ExbD [Gammaproteobacteria bacterium]|nr:biopolymer transporter ExbD [Gammaproteobacteria bacterium]MCY3841462.1 biopolymer transporter ExbD [Gammaproteobacteria bacterium]
MRQISRRKPDEEWEINITPMLDIVFIMLIFFIVTTSFVREPGIDPVRPLAQTAATKERANILIAVSSADQVWMNNRSVALHGIRQLVEAARAENPQSSVVIVADQTASTGLVLDLMDNVRAAGVTSIALAAEGVDSL